VQFTETVLEGTVDSIIYQNSENGYTILRLDVGEEEPVSVVGCIPGAAPGEGLVVWGVWSKHATYGEQFKANIVRREMPQGKEAILEYLSSGILKGMGRSTARKIVALFGDQALSVLENKPEKLTAIKGLTRKRALEWSRAFRLQVGMRRLLEFLTAHGLDPRLGMPLYQRYGERTMEVVTQNPYVLTEGEVAIPFAQADALALELGFEQDNPKRIMAALTFELRYNLNNGHTFLPRRKLLAATQALIGVPDVELLESGLDTLTADGTVYIDQIVQEEACYLAALYKAETLTAERIREMCDSGTWYPEDLDAVILQIEQNLGITYAPQQRLAVKLAAQRQILLLTGGPGTGKTTSLRGVLALFKILKLKTALAAPTGRAAKRLGELCGAESTTIHRLLETRFHFETGDLTFAHDEGDPLPVDAVIVDETSMVDIQLMAALLSALKPTCRLILVGDPDQLPSVGAGNLLADLLNSKQVPTVRLTEIFRQAAQSTIIRSAHQVNMGQVPDLRHERTSDFFFLRREDPAQAVETIVDLVGRRLPEHMGIPADQIQVLTPTRRDLGGTGNLNRALQAALNPPGQGKGERQFGDWVFRRGDRVMQVKNNYDIFWKTTDGVSEGMGVFNGDIGRILSVDNRQECITVDFDGRIVEYTPDMLSELEPAYAITVHKSQGSEYQAVVLAVLDTFPSLLTRGVLYTAMTRARELLILVGNPGIVARMVSNNRHSKRYSGLRARLAEPPQT